VEEACQAEWLAGCLNHRCLAIFSAELEPALMLRATTDLVMSQTHIRSHFGPTRRVQKGCEGVLGPA